jgi:hypothetical protein
MILSPGVTNQIAGIFNASGSPQWTAIQGRTQPSWPKILTLASNLYRSLDESAIHMRRDESLPESHQGSFAERCLLALQTIQHQLPAPIHQCCFNNLIIGDSCVGLHNGSQG